eukprot:c14225_g1_i1 orf=20-349(-)
MHPHFPENKKQFFLSGNMFLGHIPSREQAGDIPCPFSYSLGRECSHPRLQNFKPVSYKMRSGYGVLNMHTDWYLTKAALFSGCLHDERVAVDSALSIQLGQFSLYQRHA